MALVKGDSVVLYAYDSGQWKPFVCARDCSYEVTTDVIETSQSGSGNYASYLPTKHNIQISMSGVVGLVESNSLTIADLRLKQYAKNPLLVRFQRTDESANVYTEEITAYIIQSSDTGSFQDIATFSITLKGSGAVTIVYTPTPTTTGKMNRLDYTATGGEYGFTSLDLINKDVVEFVKDGIGFATKITSGTPVGKEFKHNPTTGEVVCAIPFEPEEIAYVTYQDM